MIKALVLILTIIVNAYAQELVASVLIIPNPAVNDRKVSGTLKIVQSVTNGPVTVTGTITGLNKEALHGFHVHAKGDLSEGCKSTGPHFNPEKVKHGAPSDTIRHVGDLGNIKSNDKGEAQVNITDTMISLSGSHNIIGRAFVVHSQADDLGRGNSSLSSETGNAGERWACGVIGILSPEGSWPNGASSTHHVGFIFLLSAATYLIS